MAEEEEKAVNEWDENVQRRTLNSVSMRPDLKSANGSGPSSRSSTPNGIGRHQSPSSPLRSSRRHGNSARLSSPGDHNHSSSGSDFPEVDVVNREDTLLSTNERANGSVTDDDDGVFTSSPYAYSPRTGRRMFRANFDVQGYDAKNIEVKLAGRRLVIHALQAEHEKGRKSTTEYCRKVRVPPDVDMDTLRCFHANDTLTVEAPAKPSSSNTDVTRSTSSPLPSPLSPEGTVSGHNEPFNVVTFKTAPDGHRDITLLVEVGRVFRADDVTVKMAGPAKIVVNAQRSEESAASKLTASLSREFNLPATIVPESLKAGYMASGLLRIGARVLDNQHDVSNSSVNGNVLLPSNINKNQ